MLKASCFSLALNVCVCVKLCVCVCGMPEVMCEVCTSAKSCTKSVRSCDAHANMVCPTRTMETQTHPLPSCHKSVG